MIYFIIPISLFLAFTAPTISSYWPTIYKEAVCIGAALLFVFFNKNKIAINKINVFLIFFIFSVLATYLFTQRYIQSSIIAVLYCVLLILTVSAFSSKEKNHHLELICYSIIAAAIFNFFIQLSQAGLLDLSIIALPLNGDRLYANLGQANHMGTVFVLSIAALFFIQPKNRFLKLLSLFLSIVFALGLYLTQSRTGLLSLAVIFIISLIKNESRRIALWNIIPSTFVSIFLFNYFRQRDFLDSDGGSGRIDIWLLLLKSIWNEKWVGYGIGNNAIAQFINANAFQKEVFGHSHNIIIDFFIWFGVPCGLVISILYLLIFLDKIIIKTENIKNTLIISPIAIHSFLEYPFSYFYFLLIFFAFASPVYSEKTTFLKFPETLKKIICGFLLIIFILVLIDYAKISFAYKIQAGNINLSYPLDDQAEVQSFFLDEYATYTNLLKRTTSYTIEDYDSLKFLIQKNPVEFNFKKLESLAHMHNDEETLNLLKIKSPLFVKKP